MIHFSRTFEHVLLLNEIIFQYSYCCCFFSRSRKISFIFRLTFCSRRFNLSYKISSLHTLQSCRPGLLPARRLVACQARPPSRMNFGRFGLTPSVRAMAWPGPRPGQAKIVGLQANDSYFSYRDLE